jgi:hopanoid biosynthesis associated RND transporter like protein HpnN
VGRITQASASLLARWVSFIGRHPAAVLAVAMLLTAGTLFYTVGHFEIDADADKLVSKELPFRKTETAFYRAFPQLGDTLLVVIQGETPEAAQGAARLGEGRLKEKSHLFRSIYYPGGDDFFRRNGLLYLSTGELDDLADRLASSQALLALLARDPSLRGLFSVLEQALGRNEDMAGEGLSPLLEKMAGTFREAAAGRPSRISWERLLGDGEAPSGAAREMLVLQPVLDEQELMPAEAAMRAVNEAIRDIKNTPGLTVSLTGDVALARENLLVVRRAAGFAALASLLLVTMALFAGLGSWRLVLASVLALLTGLILTTAFALFFVGRLNIISITFAVLFIGLGIDYSIQTCLRYQELRGAGEGRDEALQGTARGVGNSLLLCAVTTSVGFFAFVPTAYAGVSELGLISGTGMFINFFVNVTVLPALLALMRLRRKREGYLVSVTEKVSRLPYRHSRRIIIAVVVLGLGAAVFVPRARFDYNPLNLYDPHAESVMAMKELFREPGLAPWTADVVARSEKEAASLARQFEGSEQVKRAVTVVDFVPERQAEKLETISEMSLFMPPVPRSITRLSMGEYDKALSSFRESLDGFLARGGADAALRKAALSLRDALEDFQGSLDGRDAGRAFGQVQEALLGNLPPALENLRTSLGARRVGQEDLPPALLRRYVTPDGRYRVEVFPEKDVSHIDNLKEFVSAARGISPEVTGPPVVIVETGRAIVSSFKEATFLALGGIAVLLLLLFWNVLAAGLVLFPLLLAILYTIASSVLLGVSFNYANIIVIPLLLGVGVDYGVHFVHRFQVEQSGDFNMLRTSTARGVLFSALTTILSFISLASTSHRGMASMGILLSLCMGFLIVCTLVALPPLLGLAHGRIGRPRAE